MTAALATIKSLHYKNVSVFLFEDFSRRLVNAYRDLEGTDEDMTSYLKVKTLLEKVEISHPRVEVAKSHVQQNFCNDITGALAYFSVEFAEMFADAVVHKRGRARIHATDTSDRSVRQRLEDGPTRHPDGTFVFYGVDVTDPTRTFSSQEMADLGPRGQAYVFQEREKLNGGRSGQGRGLGRGGRGGRGFRGRYGGRG